MDEARKRQILQLWEDARNNIERLSVIDNATGRGVDGAVLGVRMGVE